MLLQIDPDNTDTFDTEKATIDVKNEMMNEEYIYLIEDPELKEGLDEEK